MTAGATPPAGGPRPWLATARALRIMTAVGRRDIERTGNVDEKTWESIEALADELIKSMPPDAPRPR